MLIGAAVVTLGLSIYLNSAGFLDSEIPSGQGTGEFEASATAASEPSDRAVDAPADRAMSATPTRSEGTFDAKSKEGVLRRDGEVMSEWGDYVRFQIVAKNCGYRAQDFVTETGSVGQATWICDREIIADHPYGSMTNDQLEQIARTDGAAALILGYRLRDGAVTPERYSQAIEHTYNAVLLTGEPQAYEQLMQHQDISDRMQKMNGRIDAASIANGYVWVKTGVELGILPKAALGRALRNVNETGTLSVDNLDSLSAALIAEFNNERLALLGQTFE